LDTLLLLGELVNTTTEPENRAAGFPFPKTKVEVGVKRGGLLSVFYVVSHIKHSICSKMKVGDSFFLQLLFSFVGFEALLATCFP
jgi:hypothetical protein